MRVLIAGMDGYLGWAMAQHLASRGHEIAGIDLFLRRAWVDEMGSYSAIPVPPMAERLGGFGDRFGKIPMFWQGDLRDYSVVEEAFKEFEPETVLHLGECPSAPYSMMDREHTMFVQSNNLMGTFNILFALRDHAPSAQLVKLGTMGEYGTPNLDIPEGFFEVEYRGRRDRIPFPRQAGSWYHWSKVHGSNNIMFACKTWGIRSTDVMQGVVFGTRIGPEAIEPPMATRLDFDQAFGTVINRFCCQAIIGHPLTVYGAGGQRRGFLPLRDSMQCLTLAIENPPEPGEYRVVNQFEETYGVEELAHKVQGVAASLGLSVEIGHYDNPRHEVHQQHYYHPDHDRLFQLGYLPTRPIDAEIAGMIEDLLPHRTRIRDKEAILVPSVRWSGDHRRSRQLV